jgi:type I restriction enzyme M protein
MGIVMDNGVLFRGSSEGKIRKEFIEKDLIEAAIGLPSNLFYNTGSPGCLLLFNDNKPDNQKGKILFIDASKDYQDGKNQNHLREKDIKKTAMVFDEFETVDRYCTVADLDEVRENDYNLNISRYVDTSESVEEIDLSQVISNLSYLEEERSSIQDRIDAYLKELNL